jgi:hypothetical protein
MVSFEFGFPAPALLNLYFAVMKEPRDSTLSKVIPTKIVLRESDSHRRFVAMS